MSLEDMVAWATQAEQDLWRSTCMITRPGPGVKRLDPVTLKYQTAPIDVVYDGPCQVRPLRRDRDVERELGGTAVEVNEYVVKVPLDIPVRRLDDLVITGSPDPSLIGVATVVKALPADEWAPVHRLVCEEVTA